MTRDEFAALLNQGMTERNWSIQQLAEASGLAYETVRSAIRGQTSPSMETANKILASVGRRLTSEELPHAPQLAPTPESTHA